MPRDLQWASGSLDTVRGRVSSAWSRAGDSLRMEVTVPIGSTAEIHIPKFGLRDVVVEESGRPVWKNGAFQAGVSGLTAAREADGAVILEAGSGVYFFERKGTY
jgi:alpha-L-rhamnosidase